MTNTMKVLVAGASGVYGRHLAKALTDAGHEVIGVGRGPRNAVRADILDRDALLRAVDGRAADVVIHAATALHKPPVRHRDMTATDALRVEGTANLLAAAREIGARRFVAESMVFGYGFGDFGQRPLTEADPFAPTGRDAQLERHIAAMRTKEELTFTTDGIEGVTLRFGLFYGSGATETVLAMLRRRALPVPDDHGRALPWVELGDAATAMLAAVERGRPGQAYNIADDTPIGFGGHVRAVAEAFRAPRPLTVPLWALRPMAYAHTVMSTNLRVSTAKAKAELGWTPRWSSSVEGLAALAGEARSRAA